MANPSIKRGNNRVAVNSIPINGLRVKSLLPRRFAAWVLEVCLISASSFVPYAIGSYIASQSQTEQVPLNSVLVEVEEAIAGTLALPRRQSQHQVAPLTNLFWSLALITPLTLTGWQIYLLGKTGQTSPKKWLGVRVVTASGKPPGLMRALVREGVGKWGLPMGVAYLLWRYSWAFPNLGLLLGLTGILIVGEGGMLLIKSRRRPLHDQILNTVVIDAKRRISSPNYAYRRQPPQPSNQPITIEVQRPKKPSGTNPNPQQLRPETITTIVLTNQAEVSQSNLWQWMRQHPGVILLIFAGTGMSLLLGTIIGTQVYLQSQADQRQIQQQNQQAFLTLVNQLNATSTDPIQERKSVILALARLDDPRTAPLLVDLLGQESNPDLINTLQQAMASLGLKVLPPLRKLNQSLSNQLKSLSKVDSEPSQEAELVALRLKATKEAITKLLVLYSGQLNYANLNHVDLSSNNDDYQKFSLILQQNDLSGINLRGAILTQVNLRGSVFSNAGNDKHLGTFDDRLADLSSADLRGTDLTEAVLSQISLNGANLMQAILNRADLSNAKLNQANLSSVQLMGANLEKASLEKASLTGADLGGANFSSANLQRANLGQVRAIGTQFSSANLAQSNWQACDLSASNFSNANLEQADLSSTELKGANLSKAQLQNANLAYANLSNADLRGANLAGANFRGVTFAVEPSKSSEQFLKAAPISESMAKIKGVNFAEVKNLSPTQMEIICSNGGYHPQCSSGK